jgi:hypothetical protein
MLSNNPNKKPFPRSHFLDPVLSAGLRERIHPLQRASLEPSFRAADPTNWPHSLGAMDIFADNLGMLVGEQFIEHRKGEYFSAMGSHFDDYETATELVIPRRPWTGSYLLGRARKANAGEPRPAVRLMVEAGAAANQWEPKAVGFDAEPAEPEESLDLLRRFHGIPWEMLLPTDWQPPLEVPYVSNQQTGVLLPEGASRVVPPNRLLHPREATPDLPLRVGLQADDLRFYNRVIRDQGQHPTCVAHAVATGLTVAAHRAGFGRMLRHPFSPSWIHCDSAEDRPWSEGRHLSDAVRSFTHGLPCTEGTFPYPDPHEGYGWRTQSREAEANNLTAKLGLPLVRKVAPAAIGEMKTLLAAGWVIVVTAHFPRRWRGPALNRYGLPLIPLEGDQREGAGHAWLLVGYDHVDGNQQWKYQGRFWCLNSWGNAWPSASIWGPGLCSLPFSFLLTEGIEAYALRWPTGKFAEAAPLH